jgi:thioesterase domain-containing protein
MPTENLKSSARGQEKSATSSPSLQARRSQFARAWLARMRSGSLIELRRGGARKLFLVHDGEGETLVYLPLARHLPDDIAVFAIEPRRLPGVPLAYATVEEMAAFGIEQVRKQQPHGPYLLGGLCAGGVIAYEMAAQLLRTGETIELVALLEAALPNAPERPGRIRERRSIRLKQAVGEVRQGGLNPGKRIAAMFAVVARKLFTMVFWEIFQLCLRLSVRARFRLLRLVLRRKLAWPKVVPELSVRQIFESAQARYQPKPLPLSSVVLVRARTGEGDDIPYREVFADETFGWNTITHNLHSIDVEGGHSTMLQEPFIDSLAGALLPYLQPNGINR